MYRVIVNTDFNKHYYMGSDITLLQLYRPVDFSDYIRPVCLPGPNTQLPPHTSCWITGWGMVTEDREWGQGRRGEQGLRKKGESSDHCGALPDLRACLLSVQVSFGPWFKTV